MIGVGVSLRNLRNSVSSAALSQYAVLGLEPPLVLDFDENYFRTGGTATDLVSAATHTRASSATYVDANGILQTAAINGPRVGHHSWNGSAWVDEGYLHESEARTNLVTYSNDFDNAAWTKSNGMIVGTQTVGSPFGTYRLLTAFESRATPPQVFQIGKTLIIGETYVAWALVKHSVGSGWFAINLYDTSKADERAWFDVQNGVVGSKDSLIKDYDMVDYGDGWWLCWASSDAANNSGGAAFEVISGDGLVSCVAGDATLCAGAQLEDGSTPSSYIPTAGAAVTRAADALAEVTPPWGGALSVNIKGTETFADENSATQKLIYDRRVDANNRITLALDTAGANTGKLTLTMANGGSSATISTTAELTPNINEPFNVAFVCTATELGIALNGTAETRVTHAVGLPDLSAEVAAFAGMGTRSLIREWADDLTDQGIAEASA